MLAFSTWLSHESHQVTIDRSQSFNRISTLHSLVGWVSYYCRHSLVHTHVDGGATCSVLNNKAPILCVDVGRWRTTWTVCWVWTAAHGAGGLVFQWCITIKSPWVCTTGYTHWYDLLRCCQDVKLQQRQQRTPDVGNAWFLLLFSYFNYFNYFN